MIWMDGAQFLYQNFHQGNITADFYHEIAVGWRMDTVNSFFSKQPIQCFVYFIFTTLESGEVRCKVDTNNNLDFSDEREFTPADQGSINVNAFNSVVVKFQIVQSDRIEETSARFLFLSNGKGGVLTSLVQHASTTLWDGAIKTTIKIYSPVADFGSSVLLVGDHVSGENVLETLTHEGEVFSLNGNRYQHIGIDRNKRVLKLRRL
jgi:hypothetical protein